MKKKAPKKPLPQKKKATARKTQQQLPGGKGFTSAILEAANLLVVILDRECRIVYFNGMCQKLTGYSLEEVRGRRLWDFLLLPEEVGSVKATFHELLGGRGNQQECHWLAKDGRRLLVSWSNSVAMRDRKVESVIRIGIDRTKREEAQMRDREREATLRALLETATQAILTVDQKGRIELANAAAAKMYGYDRIELIGRSLESLVPERLRQPHARHRAAWFADPRSRPMGSGLDLNGLRKDGSEFPVEVSLSYIGTREGTLGVAFVSDITERKKNEATLLQYQEQLQKLTGALLAAQESGNRELARELHDVFSQELAAVKMEISSLLGPKGAPASLAARLRKIGERIGQVADNIHNASRQLHPAILEELGLEAALRDECQKFSRHAGIPVLFNVEDVPVSLPADVSLCLYRVAQESLRNIGKHAAASEVQVWLAGVRDGVQLRIEDSGDGFDVETALKKGGLGLISMEERVRLVNGKLSIQSQPKKGTKVEALVPLSKTK